MSNHCWWIKGHWKTGNVSLTTDPQYIFFRFWKMPSSNQDEMLNHLFLRIARRRGSRRKREEIMMKKKERRKYGKGGSPAGWEKIICGCPVQRCLRFGGRRTERKKRERWGLWSKSMRVRSAAEEIKKRMKKRRDAVQGSTPGFINSR